MADVHWVHRATHDGGGQEPSGRAVDGHARDYVRDFKCRMPFLVVDGKGIDDTGAGDGFAYDVFRKTFAANRTRRMNECRTVLAAHEPQLADGAPGPEGTIVDIQPRLRS